MIASLRGRLAELDDERAVIDVQGVGYEVFLSRNTAVALEGQDTVRLLIYTHVREEAFSLFGFAQRSERELFLNLLKISGIGPKVALSVLSAARVEELVDLIDRGDVRGLSSLPKIGKKKAEQIVLQLKGHLEFVEDAAAPVARGVRQDIVSALVNLGFRSADVERIVHAMPVETEFADGVRMGLAQLALQN
jgi:Holliday junction DNA helicase RuvA